MIIKLRDIGNKGLIKDVVPHEAPDGYLTEALNVRFSARGILRWPTARHLYNTSGGIRVASCRKGDGSAVFYASPSALNMTVGGAFTNVSRAAPYNAAEDWHEEVYGRTMIFNSYTNVPQVMEESDVQFKDLPNWPVGTFAKLMRVYKAFFVAVGVQEGADEKDNVVWWSDAAYNNGVPPNWLYGDPSSFSGQATVAAGDGKLVDARVMGDTLVIYAEHSATAMQFSGNISFPMQFRELFKYGCLNRDCVGVFDRRHFVVGPEHIWVHDGVNVQRVAEGRVERAIYADMMNRDLVKVAMNAPSYEAMIYFQSSEAGNPYVAWVWNWQYNTWTRVELPEVRHIWYGPPESNQTLWSDLQSAGTTWGDLGTAGTSWDGLSGDRQQNILMELRPSELRQAFFDYDVDESRPYKVSRIQRVGIDLDAMGEFNSRTIKFLRRVYPIMSGEDSARVRMRFGWANAADSAVNWKGWADFSVRDGVKLDTRITGRYLAFELEGRASDPGGWVLTGFDFDVEAAGER